MLVVPCPENREEVQRQQENNKYENEYAYLAVYYSSLAP